MYKKPTLADSIRQVPMWGIWITAFSLVALILGIFEPLSTLEAVLERELGVEQVQLLAYVAGFTLPLTAGITIIGYALISGYEKTLNWSPVNKFGAALLVLFIAGLFSHLLGLGLPPSYPAPRGGPWYFMLAYVVLMGYFSTYGIQLMLCSLAIGLALAIQIERCIGD